MIGKDCFRWPNSKEEASMLIDKRQLSWLLDGFEIEQKYAHHKIEYSTHSEPHRPALKATQSINQSRLYTFSCKMYL